MSAYINIETSKYPFYEGDIRLLYPDMGDVFVCPAEFALVKSTPIPQHDENTQSVELSTPLFIDDEWVQQWKIVDLDAKTIKRWQTRPTDKSNVYAYNEETEKWEVSEFYGQQDLPIINTDNEPNNE